MKSFALFFIGLSSILIGCSDIQTNPTEQSVLYSIANSDTTVSDTAITSQVVLNGRKPDGKRPNPTVFADLLVKLNLTPDQKLIVDKLILDYKSCVESCVNAMKTAEREILMNAKLEEASIKTKLRNGEITREAARKQLQEIRQKTNDQLRALPRGKVRECVNSCDNAFVMGLRRILNTEQGKILDAWLLSREKRGSSSDGPSKGRG